MIHVKGTDNSEVLDEADGVTYGADTVIGYGGNDLIYGLNGDDLIYGGEGNDGLIGGWGADLLIGGNGMDIAYYMDSLQGVYVSLATGYGYFGTAEGDRLDGIENLAGSDYGDHLYGDVGSNILYGLGGNDFLSGGGGADRLIGSSGTDTAYYALSPARVSISLANNVNHDGDAEGDTLSSIENVIGSHFHDFLGGDNGINQLSGGHGNDHLFGFDGSDTLNGDSGSDLLNGGAGADAMIGGVGDDIYYVESAADAVTEHGGEGADSVYTSISWTLTAGADVESLRTTYDGGVNPINLTGNSSGNVVTGNNGNNVINGGDGNDNLTGLGGQDWFGFDTALSEAFNVDVITDFNVAEDAIMLENAILAALPTGALAANRFVVGPSASDPGHRIIYNSSTGALLYDSDGNGAVPAVQFAQLGTGLALTSSDFFVV
jgi:Ca2+-binding RTX toxin-like protein